MWVLGVWMGFLGAWGVEGGGGLGFAVREHRCGWALTWNANFTIKKKTDLETTPAKSV